MEKRPSKLSATFVKNVARPGRYGDGRGGHGLSLLVKRTRNGRWSRTWSVRFRRGGQVTSAGIGSYPVVTLAEARRTALEIQRRARRGEDPRGDDRIPTFAQAVEKVAAIHRKGWTPEHEYQWRGSLARHAAPRLGALRIDRITSADIIAALTADDFWNEKRETAKRVRARISAVMRWAIARRYRTDDPARDVDAALPKGGRRVRHLAAVHHGEVAAALEKARATPAYETLRLVFRFAVLTAARSGEARGARWDEIDLANRVWTIPGSRMKSRRGHRVPLSPQALEVLAAADLHRDDSGLVFPTAGGKVIGASIVSEFVRRMEISGTLHGMRSAFRNWAAETGVRRELAERAIAHVIGNRAEQAYNRTTLFEERRALMETWGAYCCP